MASLRRGGVWLRVYPQDHGRHVHAFVGESQVIVELRQDGCVELAIRDDAIRPANAKQSDVRKALRVVAEYFEELAALWEGMHDGSD